MKKKSIFKRGLSMLLAVLLCASLVLPAHAADMAESADEISTESEALNDEASVPGEVQEEVEASNPDENTVEEPQMEEATEAETEETPYGRQFLIGNYGTAYLSEDGIMPYAVGDTVYIEKGQKIAYAGYATFKYTAHVNGNEYLCFCAEPNKSSTSGYYTVSKLDPATDVGRQVLCALIRGYGGPLYESYAKDNWWDEDVNDNLRYGYTHALIGRLYCGSTKGLPQSVIEWTEIIEAENNIALADPDSELNQIIDDYTAFVAYNDAGQDMVWLEYTPRPKNTIIHLSKTSTDPNVTDGNTCYSLAGAVYGVYTDSDCTDRVTTITTDSNGKGNSSEIEQSVYYLKEITASPGYQLDTEVYTVDGTGTDAYANVTERPANDPAVITLDKISSETVTNVPSLAGAQFTIRYYDGQYSSVSQLPTEATRTWVIETKSATNGSQTRYWTMLSDEFKVAGDEFYTISGLPVLPIGTITVQETLAPVGYTLNGAYLDNSSGQIVSDSNGVVLMNITQNGNGGVGRLNGGNEYTKQDVEIYGGVQINKLDADTGLNEAYSGASLSGMTVDIISRNELSIDVNGKTYNNGEVITTLTTDSNGHAATTSKYLPYGDYELKETKAPAGYVLPDNASQLISISEDNKFVSLNFSDPIIRGDFELRKIDIDSQQSMADVLFSITNDTTGETHQFMTDENGVFSSATEYNAHSQHTNAGTVGSGLWFGQYVAADGSVKQISVDDARGALPYGTYTITELPCDANKDYIMWSGKITVSRNNFVVDLKDVENYQMRLSTTAKDEETNSHYASSVGEITILDNVRYENLLKDTQYTLVSVLMNKATQQPVRDADGNIVSATKTSVTKTRSGQLDMELVFDATPLAGTDVVVFEYLFLGDKGDVSGNGAALSHADINDEDQTIHLPKITSSLRDKETGTNVSNAGEITQIDTVTYENLNPGKTYIMSGKLMNKATGQPALDDNGDEITATAKFKPTEPNGSVDVTFTFTGYTLVGETLVAFETLQYRGDDWAVHADLNDENQTIYIPAVNTEATSKITGDHIAKAEKDAPQIDRVTLRNLVVGKEYTLTSELIGVPDEAKLAEASKTFTATASDMEILMEVTLDASERAGTETVFFETLTYNGVVVGAHRDLNDKDQAIAFPEIYTTALDVESGTHNAMTDSDVTVRDIVHYSKLLVGKEYTVNGTLMNKSTGEILLDADGTPVTAATSFTPSELDGSVELTFHFDGTGLAGETVVAFETLSFNGIEIAVHADLEDEEQSIHFVELSTAAVETNSGEHIAMAAPDTELTDYVTMKNLIVGQEYHLRSEFIAKATGETLATVEKDFTATEETMTVPMVVKLDTTELAGSSVVFFESLTANGVEVGTHRDIDDENQTIVFPEIHTTAQDVEFGGHYSIADGDVSILDVVHYKGLLIGKEYTVSGTLMVKSTDKALLDKDGNPVMASTTFTTEQANGSVEVVFRFNGSALAGDAVIAFESLIYQGIEIAAHMDINDEEQTVYFPGIHTTAIDSTSKSHKATASGTVTILDTVDYTNLIPGQLYTVVGTLMDKATGSALLDKDGNPITASMTFTPAMANGSVEMNFAFDATGLGGHTVVVFERVYLGTDTTVQPVAVHEDINDADQSVELVVPPAAPKTGDTVAPMLVGMLLLASASGLAVLVRIKRRMH